MKKTKIFGILLISSAIILSIIVIGYTVLFSIFGIKSGWSLLMITPLIIIAIILIIALSFVLNAGIKKIKDEK